MTNEDKFEINFTEEVGELAQNDQQFQIALNKFIALSTNIELKNFLNFEYILDDIFKQSCRCNSTKNFILAFSLHFKRNISKN